MRALLLVILGLVVGAMGASFALSALHQGTPFHKGVMAVMQYHVGRLREDVRARRCDAKTSLSHLVRLRQSAGDLRDAFPDMDAAFFTAGDRLIGSVDRGIEAAPATCEALAAALQPIGQACQTCHQQYR